MTWEQIRFRWHVAKGLRELGRIETDDFLAEPPKSAFDGLMLRDMLLMYQVGSGTVREVEIWLGRMFPKPAKTAFKIQRAIEMLELLGYTVLPPK